MDLLKPRNVIDYIENHHGDVFVNFLSDVNLGMLNGCFQDNEFTVDSHFLEFDGTMEKI